jgi:alkylation response protein AidB-like acyl-CoA dehydrogenase
LTTDTETASAAELDSERIDAVRQAVTAITDDLGRRYWLEVVRRGGEPHELLSAMASTGLLGVGLSEKLGGSGGGISDEAMLMETLGRGGIPQSRIIIPGFVRRMVAKWGSPDQARQVVEATLSGTAATSFAFTEAESGSNAFAMKTKAELVGDSWIINGQKTYITNAGIADQMLIGARTGTDPNGRARISLFLTKLPVAGISFTPLDIRASPPEKQYVVYFDNVELPADALVGEEGSGARSMFTALNPERILTAAGTVGLGHFVLEQASDYVRGRAPFGQPTGSYQGVQHPLARAYVALEAARLMTYEAAAEVDRGVDAGMKSNVCKFLASEAACAAIDAAIQVCGGYAFDYDSNIMWLYEHLRLRRIAPLNNEMILNFVAERALGLPRSY